MLYQSPVLSAAPIRCLAVHPRPEARILALGFEDGVVRFFSLPQLSGASDQPKCYAVPVSVAQVAAGVSVGGGRRQGQRRASSFPCRELHSIDIARELRWRGSVPALGGVDDSNGGCAAKGGALVSSEPVWLAPVDKEAEVSSGGTEMTSLAALSIHFVEASLQATERNRTGHTNICGVEDDDSFARSVIDAVCSMSAFCICVHHSLTYSCTLFFILVRRYTICVYPWRAVQHWHCFVSTATTGGGTGKFTVFSTTKHTRHFPL